MSTPTPKRQTGLVTGASAGLGVEYAKLLAADGHRVVLTARREDRLQALAAELKSAFQTESLVLSVDLSLAAGPRQVFDACRSAGWEVDLLINNAGLGGSGAVAELSLESQLRQIQVNVTSLTALTRLFLPGMLERKFGRILNIASTAAYQAGPSMAVYYATKAYVLSFTEALALELKGSGVTATAHCPGATHTEFAAVAHLEQSPLFQRPGVATAREAALDGYRAMQRGQVSKIHGFANAFMAFATRLGPRTTNAAIAAKLNRPKPRKP